MTGSANESAETNARISLRTWCVVLGCFAIMICDGYDLTVIAITLPSIAKAWHIATAEFGYIFSASIVGIMIGAPLSGALADRLGRKPVLLSCTLIFGIGSLCTAFTHSMSALLVVRVISGLGLGGAVPLSIALVGEHSPPRYRARLICLIISGPGVGAALPGVAATYLLAHSGWSLLFILGGLAPIAAAAISLWLITESPQFLARIRDRDEIRNASSTTMAIAPKTRLAEIFAGRLAYVTPALWIGFIAIGIVTYFIQSWTPTLYLARGHSIGEVALATTMFQVGAALSGLIIGWPVDRFGAKCITIAFMLSVPCIALLGSPEALAGLLPVVLGLSGLLILSAHSASCSLAATIYATEIRGVGVGLGLGTMRLGQIMGTVLGGALISSGLTMPLIFSMAALTFFIGGVASFALQGKPHGPMPDIRNELTGNKP
jgi:AAHS family 4-hydroxybenzoate transporter-like MFS transporter